MLRTKSFALCTFVWIGADRLWAGDPGPTQTISPDGQGYHSPIPADQPFPSTHYGAAHGGSTLTLTYPFTSPFGFTDHSRGQFVYSCSPFFPRSSEGVFGMDVWLEQLDGAGNWNPADINGGIADGHGSPYQPINTPNPGPSPGYVFTWTFDPGRLPPNAIFRVFVYVYIYNQGGASQGLFPIYSSVGIATTGAANDVPRIAWSPTGGATNPDQVYAGDTYVISADAQDDNGDLIAVSIDKNGQPFAYAGGGSGYAGNSQNPTSDPVGSVTYTVWANDAYGAQSPIISRTVSVVPRPILPPVGAFDGVTPGTVPQGQIITGTGWAADAQLGAPISAVLILIDGGASGSLYAALGGSRPDVQAANTSWGHWSPFDITNSGWAFSFNTSGLSQGGHSFTAIAYDFPYGVSATVGSQSFSVGPPPSQPPYITAVWADRTHFYVGDSTVLHVAAADATANLQYVNLDEIGGPGAGGYFGPGNNFNAASPPNNGWNNLGFLTDSYQRDVTLGFPAAGTYTFSGAALNDQGQYVNHASGGGPTASVRVANPPSGSIWADATSLTAGQSTVIHATFAADSSNGDDIAGTNIDQPLGTGVGDGSAQTARNYSFTPALPGSYTFYARMFTTLSGGWQTFGQVSVSVAPAPQFVSLSPASAAITAGQQVVFTAGGGANGYIWGGSASGTGGSQAVTFPSPGTFAVTVYSPGGGSYSESATLTATITVNPAGQTVSLTPGAPAIIAGNSITFSASGGMNDYVWSGAAAGAGSLKTVSFPNIGSYSVSVYSPAGGIYAQSNTASATVTVSPIPQTVVLTPSAPVIDAAQSIVFSASGGLNGYIWGGSANGGGASQTVAFPDAGTFAVTVYSPAGGNVAQSNTAGASITVKSLPAPGTASVTVKPKGGDVKVQNASNRHSSQILVPK